MRKYQIGILFACLTAFIFFSTHDAAATTTIISSNTNMTTLTIKSGDTLQINNGATLLINSTLDNFGKINVQAGGSLGERIHEVGPITNHKGATINNSGEIYHESTLNYGKINNGGPISGGEITNRGKINNNGGLGLEGTSSLHNYGTINNIGPKGFIGGDSGASTINHEGATINNSGEMHADEAGLVNDGKINNRGFIQGADDVFINHESGVINNSHKGVIRLYVEGGNINAGLINNRGIINLDGFNPFNNTGTINNRGTINADFDSIFDNTGGKLKDICGGVINNLGHLLGNAIITGC